MFVYFSAYQFLKAAFLAMWCDFECYVMKREEKQRADENINITECMRFSSLLFLPSCPLTRYMCVFKPINYIGSTFMLLLSSMYLGALMATIQCRLRIATRVAL